MSSSPHISRRSCVSLPSKGARRVRGLDLIFSASVQAEAGVPDNRVVTCQASGFHPRFVLSCHLTSVPLEPGAQAPGPGEGKAAGGILEHVVWVTFPNPLPLPPQERWTECTQLV